MTAAAAAPPRQTQPVTVDRRCVVTGIGVVAPTGIGHAEHWTSTVAGECRIGPITAFDATGYGSGLAGEVPRFEATEHIDGRLIVQTDRWTWFGLAATELALRDAGLDSVSAEPYQMSAVTASASGGNALGQREISALWATGPSAVTVHQSIGWFYSASTGLISIRHQAKGPCSVVITDGAGGLDSVAVARRLIGRGQAAAIVGGTEAPVSPYALACQLSSGRLSTGRDPALAYRPFHADAAGYVIGEGGAMLVMEDLTTALERGAGQVYAEVRGHAATFDSTLDGSGLARAMTLALNRAGCSPERVDLILADGAGDPAGDAAEAAAIRSVFGPRAHTVPVSVPKSMTGRLHSGAAALDVATGALAIRHNRLPPTVNVPANPYELNLVTQSRPADVACVLVLARGHGGFHSALVLHRLET
ncbi:MAG: minimal chain-length factor beta [Micromonosporaceae bacterium]|nr:minimal chain-length factor beta [Micromonosporaceae bacterium]